MRHPLFEKTIFVPSGDQSGQAGSLACFVLSAVPVCWPPEIGIVPIKKGPPAVAKSVIVKTTVIPSGETEGSAYESSETPVPVVNRWTLLPSASMMKSWKLQLSKLEPHVGLSRLEENTILPSGVQVGWVFTPVLPGVTRARFEPSAFIVKIPN